MSTLLSGATAPATSFAPLGVPDGLIDALAKQGITCPRPIQAATIADALAGRDVTAKAPTGSGKTLAFAVPLAARLSRGTAKRPRALVLVPTRELASQIAEAMRPLLAVRGLKVQTFYGGVGFGAQRNALRRGTDVAVACPGRLEDLVAQGDVRLSDVDFVVVDEADRMADMGFLPAVRRLLDATAPRRQTLLFSATLDGAVDVLVRQYQVDPIRHEVAPTNEEAGRVTHVFESVEFADRLDRCVELVGGDDTSIVFVRTKHGTERVAKQLGRAGVAADAIHGGRTQVQRERTLAAFKAGRVRVLVATDVAARGIHVDGISRVVHYDLPADHKDYVHRSGRTARAGADGAVIALVVPEQRKVAAALRRDLDLEILDPAGITADRSRPSGQGRRRGGAPRSKAAAPNPRRHDGARRAQASTDRSKPEAEGRRGQHAPNRNGGRRRAGGGANPGRRRAERAPQG